MACSTISWSNVLSFAALYGLAHLGSLQPRTHRARPPSAPSLRTAPASSTSATCGRVILNSSRHRPPGRTLRSASPRRRPASFPTWLFFDFGPDGQTPIFTGDFLVDQSSRHPQSPVGRSVPCPPRPFPSAPPRRQPPSPPRYCGVRSSFVTSNPRATASATTRSYTASGIVGSRDSTHR